MSRFRFAAVAALVVGAFVFPATTALAGGTKVDVCHSEGNGSYHLINISENAFDKHVDHGDDSPDQAVPGLEGFKFDANCVPVPSVVDTDGDGVLDEDDNCPSVANADQADQYGSASGDACEDTDGNGTPDVNEASFCVSINGVDILDRGFVTCRSTASTGDLPNVAIAQGAGSYATAKNGDGNTATATGDSSFAQAYYGDGNTATATGDSSFAKAAWGDGNTATAAGYKSRATAFPPGPTVACADEEYEVAYNVNLCL